MNVGLIPEYWLTGLGSWALSYFLHSTVILGLVLILTHFVGRISESQKDVLLKMGLVAGILTASIQFAQSSYGAFRHTIIFDIAAQPTRIISGPTNAGRVISTDNLKMIIANEPLNGGEPIEHLQPQTEGRLSINWLNALLCCWLLGSALLALRFVYLWHMFKQSMGSREKLTHQPSIDLCLRLQAQMNISRPISLTQSNQIASPMAIGLSQICLPRDLWLRVDEEQMTAIVAHELAHIARLDPIWLFFWHLMSIVLFFQPLNKLTQLSFQSRAEFLADATAVRQTKDPLAMVNSLVNAAKMARNRALNSLTTYLLGTNATLVTRSKLLLSEKLIKTQASLSFIVICAIGIGALSAFWLPSVSLASRQLQDLSHEKVSLTSQNSHSWIHYADTPLGFETNIEHKESIAGQQIELQTERVVFGHDLDGIAHFKPFGYLRFASRNIYRTITLEMVADWQGHARYQYIINGEHSDDTQAMQDFIAQLLDLGLGQSDEFKRRMLRLYVEPQPVNNTAKMNQQTLGQIHRVIANRKGYYQSTDIAVAKLMLSTFGLLNASRKNLSHEVAAITSAVDYQQVTTQQRFFNAMAVSGADMASFSDLGYLSISQKVAGNVRNNVEYNLNNRYFLDVFVKASGQTYTVGQSERALVRFLVWLHFDVDKEDIRWLEE